MVLSEKLMSQIIFTLKQNELLNFKLIVDFGMNFNVKQKC